MIGRDWSVHKIVVVPEYVHVEGCAMFEDVFRMEAGLKLAKDGWRIPTSGGPGDPAEDHFALTERDRSVVWWSRGRSHEAYFTGLKREPSGKDVPHAVFGAVEEYLGVAVEPGEPVPEDLWSRLARLEHGRSSWEWSGGAIRCFKREVYRRQVRVHVGSAA